LKFKNIELIPFSDLIKYRNAGFFEIIKYTKKYDLSNREWVNALSYLVDAYNILVKDEKKFIQIYMIDELKKLLKGLAELMENDHFHFEDDKYIKDNKITGEVVNKEIDKEIEIIILRAKKITNALDFVSKIQEYQHIIEINTVIDEIENFNKNMKYILENEIKNVKQNLQNFNNEIQDLKPQYFDLQKLYKSFQDKKNLIIRKNNDLPVDKCHEIFLEENPEYLDFMEEYEPVKEKFIKLTNKYNNTKNILKDFQKYNDKIINYFNNN
jgi:hypothetical protein